MIEIRPTEPADLVGVDALFQRGFGHGLSRTAWEWKYHALPGDGRTTVAVTTEGEVLAHAGGLALPARWRDDDGVVREALMWNTVDFVAGAGGGGLRPPVVPLMFKLMEDMPRPGDAPWVIGFPSARNLRLTERIVKSSHLRRIQQWKGELAPAAERASEVAGEGAAELEMEIGDSCAVGVDGGGDQGWVERVWSACGGRGVVRSPAFLNWRYHARPERFYRFYRLRSAVEGQLIEGLAVVAFEGSEAAVTELWLPPAGDWRRAVPEIARDLLATGLVRWRLWTPPAGEASLAGLGLEPDDVVDVVYRGRLGQPLEEVRPIADAAYYAMGDHDLR
jgi:hypothetical protein